MLQLDKIIGQASDPKIAERLHQLEHANRVEYVVLDKTDTLRHRLRVVTDRGTEVAIKLARTDQLSNGVVLLLDDHRAVVVRMNEQPWLSLVPSNASAALELGYFAGNMHWKVRFDHEVLYIALDGPEQSYLDRLSVFLADGRIRRVDNV